MLATAGACPFQDAVPGLCRLPSMAESEVRQWLEMRANLINSIDSAKLPQTGFMIKPLLPEGYSPERKVNQFHPPILNERGRRTPLVPRSCGRSMSPSAAPRDVWPLTLQDMCNSKSVTTLVPETTRPGSSLELDVIMPMVEAGMDIGNSLVVKPICTVTSLVTDLAVDTTRMGYSYVLRPVGYGAAACVEGAACLPGVSYDYVLQPISVIGNAVASTVLGTIGNTLLCLACGSRDGDATPTQVVAEGAALRALSEPVVRRLSARSHRPLEPVGLSSDYERFAVVLARPELGGGSARSCL
mmetsp:Transcript_43452/g.112210  ORF Transcript_43452/g.112210 Transcript_43452/m.112210 type:complete len:300 (+) Transcript_43452:75-974(+)